MTDSAFTVVIMCTINQIVKAEGENTKEKSVRWQNKEKAKKFATEKDRKK